MTGACSNLLVFGRQFDQQSRHDHVAQHDAFRYPGWRHSDKASGVFYVTGKRWRTIFLGKFVAAK